MAIQFEDEMHVTLGPHGGFRGAEMKVCYDGTSRDGRLYQEDRDSWLEFLEPLAKRHRAKVQTTELLSARRR